MGRRCESGLLMLHVLSDICSGNPTKYSSFADSFRDIMHPLVRVPISHVQAENFDNKEETQDIVHMVKNGTTTVQSSCVHFIRDIYRVF